MKLAGEQKKQRIEFLKLIQADGKTNFLLQFQ